MVPETGAGSTHARASLEPPTSKSTPSEAWVLAPLIAGQPAYKIGRWIAGKFAYPRSAVLPRITRALPKQPAAVLVHDVDGTVATLCLDLDTSKAAPAVVRQDSANLAQLLTAAGLRYVEDFSPSGGRHLYIPLAERMDGAAARELVEAMAFTAASLDPGPHQNPVEGCIRVPGSKHKTGGHQVLITPLAEAYDMMRRRNPAAAVDHLRCLLAPELRRHQADKARKAKASGRLLQVSTAAPIASSALAERPLAITARTGLYDTSRYPTASEARMAVLNRLAALGWSLGQIRLELAGQLSGLASLYGTPEKQARLLEPEWSKACAYVAQKPPSSRAGKKPASNYDTSQPLNSRAGGEQGSKAATHQLVNDLENLLYGFLDHRLLTLGREGTGLRLLIRALLGYMRARETNLLDVGCRTLAVALGKHHGTVARLLPRLAGLSDGILSKVEDARGKHADVYLLQLPEQHQALARELSWRSGKIHGIRPVFRALGDTAALAYEAIERARLSPTSADIIRSSGLSRASVDRSTAEMAALGMIHRENGTWRITAGTNLTQLADRLGVLDHYRHHIARNRADRAAWHTWLDRHSPEQQPREEDIYDPERDEWWMPPPDADQQLYEAA